MDRGVRVTGLLQAWAGGDLEAPRCPRTNRVRRAPATRRGIPAARAARPYVAADCARARGFRPPHGPAARGVAGTCALLRRRGTDDAAGCSWITRVNATRRNARASIRVELNDEIGASPPADCEVLLLDRALDELAGLDPRQARVVELRYFGGLSEQEVGAVLSLSRATVTREWQSARAWLYRRLTTGARAEGGSNQRP